MAPAQADRVIQACEPTRCTLPHHLVSEHHGVSAGLLADIEKRPENWDRRCA
ncbi:hypothetical protein GCM10023108_42620 [Saccharopolyspora hordei]|uniref:Uncharacterized protein n=1 Tax=Saccharopolyspora hordei TaxID=1838 RepID=A0A853AFK1_9PSEU|nr:hypothetical protein [Saccharopolyspora hordei]